jgi:hypothetical protein
LGVGRVDLFMGAVLPRAILFLHRILEKFLAAASENPRVFILDHRIWTEYDQAFRKYLEEFADFEISTMERS